MTEALTDATTAELAENDLVAVPRNEWTAMMERMDRLESELSNQAQNVGGAFAKIGEVEDTVEKLEAQNQQTEPHSGDTTPRVDPGKTGPQDTETPLERICRLPEHIADRELTANQERARFIARDIHDYAEKVPAGLVIDSRAIKRVITASEGKRPHTQTVARVMTFLDELGKDAVQLKKRRGKKLVVVGPEAAARLTHHDRCDQEVAQPSPKA